MLSPNFDILRPELDVLSPILDNLSPKFDILSSIMQYQVEQIRTEEYWAINSTSCTDFDILSPRLDILSPILVPNRTSEALFSTYQALFSCNIRWS